MPINKYVQGFWVVLTCTLVVLAILSRDRGGLETVFHVLLFGCFAGWLMTRTLEGWAGRSPEHLALRLEEIDRQLAEGKNPKGRPLDAEGQTELQSARAVTVARLREAEKLGFFSRTEWR